MRRGPFPLFTTNGIANHHIPPLHLYQQPPAPPASSVASNSIINIPVHDAVSSRPSSATSSSSNSLCSSSSAASSSSNPPSSSASSSLPSPLSSASSSSSSSSLSSSSSASSFRLPALDPASAATAIQSCFRGFSLRRRKPLQYLRAIRSIRRELDGLCLKMQDVHFMARIRESEKARLGLNENIMVLLLRLDAVEGMSPEVRIRRKEEIKKAIRLQDAIDSLLHRPDNINSIAVMSPKQHHEDVHCKATEIPTETGNEIYNGDIREDYNDLIVHEVCADAEEKHNVQDVENGNAISSISSSPQGQYSQEQDLFCSSPCPQVEALEEDICTLASMEENTAGAVKEGAKARRADFLDLRGEGEGPEIDNVMSLRDELVQEDVPNGSLTEEQYHEGGGSGEEDVLLAEISSNFGVTKDEAEEEERMPLADKKGDQSTHQEAIIPDQFAAKCKQLKSLLSKLYIDSKMQNKLIAGLSNRVQRLEQQADARKKLPRKMDGMQKNKKGASMVPQPLPINNAHG